ncbi:UDP-4-amino-4-deoxy-L-arabinose--oxoglutarate aminotransferase [bacterium BMS3Abin07]|nr:UDP-4-amino-4-deoxy-L-arabinose--oxoglutarate aminotransferase [bacterium BMS3Abin07]HDO21596.1 DegT/DnrJ/EryC1/StrS family aminotransferase [Nitrospirota bacterium]
MEISFHKPYITDDDIAEVIDSMRSGWITMGPKTIDFENNFAQYIGSKNAVSMNSCTSCLHLALRAIGLEDGDEVIVPAITFTATAEVVTYFNAKPVLVDVEGETYNIDVSKIEEKISKKTKAIIPVHYAGQPCDMDEISDIAGRYKLYVIEDAAHAIPAWYKKKKIGTIGDITCFSFYATKPLTTGEGGMACTDNDEWADNMRIMRLHGISRDAWNRYSNEGSWYYEVVDAGYKYNMTDIQAALGLGQLKKIEWMWNRRKEIAGKYTKAFKSLNEVTTPYVKTDRESAWHLYVLSLNLEMLRIERNQFITELKKIGVNTSVHFIPLYRHPYYRDNMNYKSQDFPASESIFKRIISLPVYPGMTDGEVERVVEAVGDVVSKYRK